MGDLIIVVMMLSFAGLGYWTGYRSRDSLIRALEYDWQSARDEAKYWKCIAKLEGDCKNG